MPFRPLSGEIQVYLVLFASFTLAALQNVTVDDAVLTGAVVPQYLPTTALWNSVIGNNCTTCIAKPDPSLAYDGTWHDTSYFPGDDYTPAFEFTLTGTPHPLGLTCRLDDRSQRQEMPYTYSSSLQTN